MAPSQKVRIIPLGGVDEIGKNMTVIEYEDDILVVDCGSIFPDEDMLGIDLVIPDASYLEANKDRVRGYMFTHGHEDHIGATPYILQQVPAPIYGTRLTLALIEPKLREHHPEWHPDEHRRAPRRRQDRAFSPWNSSRSTTPSPAPAP